MNFAVTWASGPCWRRSEFGDVKFSTVDGVSYVARAEVANNQTPLQDKEFGEAVKIQHTVVQRTDGGAISESVKTAFDIVSGVFVSVASGKTITTLAHYLASDGNTYDNVNIVAIKGFKTIYLEAEGKFLKNGKEYSLFSDVRGAGAMQGVSLAQKESFTAKDGHQETIYRWEGSAKTGLLSILLRNGQRVDLYAADVEQGSVSQKISSIEYDANGGVKISGVSQTIRANGSVVQSVDIQNSYDKKGRLVESTLRISTPSTDMAHKAANESIATKNTDSRHNNSANRKGGKAPV